MSKTAQEYIDTFKTKLKGFQFAVCFKRMIARLLYDGDCVKEFNLNKGDVGILVDYFMWAHEEDSKPTKHHIIAELGKPVRGIPTKPSVQIYPIAGNKVITTEPITAYWVNGTYEDYLDNHKYYKPEDDD